MPLLRELLRQVVEQGASDIHLKPNQHPILRVHGELTPIGADPLTAEDLIQFISQILPPHVTKRFEVEHEADFSLEEPEVGRFRVNVFHSSGEPSIVMRHVKTRIPTFEELHLPPILKKVAESPRGIILACGTTGSGKSTTLAALIQHINQTDRLRILTIEDPIEYIFQDQLSVISQREVGIDTLSFHASLKHVLRQDPDVIMIGEMRDAESFMAALAASETGHLIFSTLHTGTAAQSVSRILDFFPAHERDGLRMGLSANLRAVFCQRLIPSPRYGVVPAAEIMINTPTVRKLLEKNQIEKLDAAIETGTEDGMQTFNQSIYHLIKRGDITEGEGMLRASNPEALKMNLKGIFLDESRRILTA
jgi:twitching motility protein PilT